MSSKDKIDVSSILQPTDLFGKEILPECTFQSEYGKLKFKEVIVPDFSKNKIELELLTKHLDAIEAFMKEEDLLKKSEIIDFIFGFVPHVTFGRVTAALDLTKSSLFINILRASILFRLFKMEGKCNAIYVLISGMKCQLSFILSCYGMELHQFNHLHVPLEYIYNHQEISESEFSW